MKKTLFCVNCTTCGARIRFYDGSRVGQIIPCPKCESMVLVEKMESGEECGPNGRNEPAEEDSESHSMKLPSPPPVPETHAEHSARSASAARSAHSTQSDPLSVGGVPSWGERRSDALGEVPSWPRETGNAGSAAGTESIEIEDEEELGNSDFEFDAESVPGWTPRGLALVMGSVAGGIFLAGVLGFSFLKKDGKETALELKLPEVSETRAADHEAGSNSGDDALGAESDLEEDALSEAADLAESQDEAQDEAQNEAQDGQDEEMSETEESGGTELLEENSDGSETHASGTDSLQNVMQSALGKKLTEELGTELETGSQDPASADGTAGTGEESVLSDPASENETQTVPENDPAETETGSEMETGSGMETGSDPDALVFDRRKRSRVYSGDDPVLNFEAVPEIDGDQPAETAGSTESEDVSRSSAPHDQAAEMPSAENGEEPLHAPVPGEETVQETPSLPQMKTFRVTAPEAEYLQRSSAEKLTISLESVSMSRRPVSSLTQFASQMSGERITADWRKLGRLGISQETPVTLELERTTLRETLDTGLYSVGLGVISVGSTLRLVGWEAAEIARSAAARGEKPTRKVLELEDLAATYATEASGQSGLGELAKIIPQFVHPALWEEGNGTGRLTANAAKSKISLQQYPSVIQEVEIFCDKIRRARNMELRTLPTQPGQRRKGMQDGTEIVDSGIVPRYALSEKVRRTPIDCDLSDGTTLRQALTEVMRCAGAQVIFDEDAIAMVPITAVIPDADVPDLEGKKRELPASILDLPCVYRFEGIPMEEAATDILKNVPLFCYPVNENVFFLTTYLEARRKMLVDFYPVGDLIRNSAAAGTIVNGICSTIETHTWTRNGGAGAIYFDLPSKTLIVRQDPLVLFQIEMFLKRFRETQDPNAKMEARERN